jgi:hypothetical protein
VDLDAKVLFDVEEASWFKVGGKGSVAGEVAVLPPSLGGTLTVMMRIPSLQVGRVVQCEMKCGISRKLQGA